MMRNSPEAVQADGEQTEDGGQNRARRQHPVGLASPVQGRPARAALGGRLRRLRLAGTGIALRALALVAGLAAALLYAGEYTRAATLFDAVGSDYRRYLPAADPLVLECAYHAGHANAETGKPDKALPQLRYFAQNADPGSDADEAERVIESRFLAAQMLAASDEPDAAAAELRALRPLLVNTFGARSTQVRNLDKQLSRLA